MTAHGAGMEFPYDLLLKGWTGAQPNSVLVSQEGRIPLDNENEGTESGDTDSLVAGPWQLDQTGTN